MCTDYDPPSFYHAEKLKARKAHECCECGRTIQPKETYEKVVGHWDGRFGVYKTCAHCLGAREWIWETCGGFLHEGLDEELIEHLGEYDWCWERVNLGFVARAVVGLRRKWKKFKSDELMPVMDLKTYRKPVLPAVEVKI